jgi:hypothetical protein
MILAIMWLCKHAHTVNKSYSTAHRDQDAGAAPDAIITLLPHCSAHPVHLLPAMSHGHSDRHRCMQQVANVPQHLKVAACIRQAVCQAICTVLMQMADAYDFVDPKDILSELKKDFWEGLAAAKWSERKAALTQLKELAAAPKLANGEYLDVNRCANACSMCARPACLAGLADA